MFIVFAIGVALIFILPVLFFTTAAAFFVWLWGVGTYYIVKWYNNKEIPGVHTDLAGGLKKAAGMSDLPGVDGESPTNGERKGNERSDKKSDERSDKRSDEEPMKEAKRQEGTNGHVEGKTTTAQHHSDGKENSSAAHPRKLTTKTSSGENDEAGAGNANGHADEVRKKVPA